MDIEIVKKINRINLNWLEEMEKALSFYSYGINSVIYSSPWIIFSFYGFFIIFAQMENEMKFDIWSDAVFWTYIIYKHFCIKSDETIILDWKNKWWINITNVTKVDEIWSKNKFIEGFWPEKKINKVWLNKNHIFKNWLTSLNYILFFIKNYYFM